MPLIPEHSVGFVHIPKCAGTTLEVALGIASDYPRIGLEVTRTSPDFTRLFGGGLQHLTARELNRNYVDQWGSLRYTFAVVRDPVERFISHFGWKHFRFLDVKDDGQGTPNREPGPAADKNHFVRLVERKLDEHVSYVESVAERFDAFRDPFAGAEYCEGTDAAPRLDEVERHLLPQCSYIFTNGDAGVHEVFNLKGLSLLRKRLIGLRVPVANFERRMSTSLGPELQASLRRRMREKVRQLYRQDEELISTLGGLSVSGSQLAQKTVIRAPLIVAGSDAERREPAIPPIEKRVPKRVWMYWHQGWDQAPPMMQHCRKSWIAYNRTWEVCCLDARSLRDFIEIPPIYGPQGVELPLASLADVIRIHLLGRHGGVWADATTFCTRPLDEWIAQVTEPSGFFVYAKPAPGRPIASWFLASEQGGAIARQFRDATNQLWRAYLVLGPGVLEQLFSLHDAEAARAFLLRLEDTESGDVGAGSAPLGDHLLSGDPSSRYYFWFHHLFGALLLRDDAFRAQWAIAPEISADEPHFLQRFGVEMAPEDAVDMHIANRFTNVYKLNRRKSITEPLDGTVLGRLMKTIDGITGSPGAAK